MASMTDPRVLFVEEAGIIDPVAKADQPTKKRPPKDLQELRTVSLNVLALIETRARLPFDHKQFTYKYPPMRDNTKKHYERMKVFMTEVYYTRLVFGLNGETRRLAGSRPYPPYRAGPYNADNAVAAVEEVRQWIDLPTLTTADSVSVVAGRAPGPFKVTKGKNINGRIMGVLGKKPEAISWTAQYWSEHLNCSKSSVVESDAWKNKIIVMRAMYATELLEPKSGRRRRSSPE